MKHFVILAAVAALASACSPANGASRVVGYAGDCTVYRVFTTMGPDVTTTVCPEGERAGTTERRRSGKTTYEETNESH